MISAQVLTVRAFGAELMKIGSGGSLEISSGGFRTWRTFQALNMVLVCVEINQCVGCTRQFFTKSFLGDDAAVLARSSGEEFTPPRRRAGVASMAWRTTGRFRTNAP